MKKLARYALVFLILAAFTQLAWASESRVVNTPQKAHFNTVLHKKHATVTKKHHKRHGHKKTKSQPPVTNP